MASMRVETNAEPIPGYRLIERLGGGGFGEVWRAEAPGGMHKAIKFVYGDVSSAGETDQRAKQEMKALERVRSVRHPYILSLERYEVVDGRLLIVMELADRNLWDRYREARAQGLPGIPREELLRYLDESAEALDLMNQEHQLQHLDIKPQNLFLVHNHVKVADFGLVKDLEGSQASVTGGVTPVYAAPETFDGKVSRFSDQYSLAIVYQELLTGQRPFTGSNVRQLIMQHISATPNVSPLPLGDQPVIARALSKSPSARFPSCRDLVSRLRAESPGARGPGPLLAPGPFPPASLTPPDRAAVRGGEPASSAGMGGVVPASWQGVVTPSPSDSGITPPLSGSRTASLRAADPDTGPSAGTTYPLRPPLDPSAGPLQGELSGFRAPPEVTGPGTLFPSLVVALGSVGLTVMQRLRENLHTHVAPLAQLPHLRFLVLDTDPEVMRTATRGGAAGGLSAGELLLTPLNRPSHYLKPRDGRPSVESWLNPRMLYRIPRSQVTAGVRALGRLALCENYRTVVRRLQLELETALEPAHLAEAARTTGLGVRTNRPRVYLITSLGGGSGSGMFIDAAYLVRALMRQMGYENPDVVALLLLPPVDRSRTRVMALGNTYAALTELLHFGSPGARFTSKYHDREPAVQEDGPPFSRIMIHPLPDETDEVGLQETADLCGQLLYRDLTSPLGKAADLGRAGLPGPPWESRGQYFQTSNLFQLSWPRHAMLTAVARRLCQRVVQRWSSKDSKPVREAVQAWVQDQWVNLELGADCFIHRMQAEVVKAAGTTADHLFQEAVEPLAEGSAQGEPAGQGRRMTFRAEPKAADPKALRETLERLEGLIGSPAEEKAPSSEETLPRLPELLRDVADRLAAEWSQKLAEMAVRLIEDPGFRLAGAEEAIRQFVASIEQVLQHHEPLARDLSEKAASAWQHLSGLLEGGGRKNALTPAETAELARVYPKWRYQSLILHHLAGAFVSLRGHLSDELREVNFCRVRLAELLRRLDEPLPGEVSPGSAQGSRHREVSLGRKLYLSGCDSLSQAVQLFLDGTGPEHLLELDERMEEMLRRDYQALVHVCLTNDNILGHVQASMLAVAREFAAEYLPPTSAGRLFFEQHPNDEEAEGELANFFDEAAPEISQSRSGRSGPPQVELCVVATPEDESSERLRGLMRRAAAAEMHEASSPDDVLIYRERNNLAISDLEQLGVVGHDAYVQMSSTDHFTPHSRCDVDFRPR